MQHRNGAIPLWTVAGLAGILGGAWIMGPDAAGPHSQDWVVQRLETLRAENVALRGEIGRLRLEFAEARSETAVGGTHPSAKQAGPGNPADSLDTHAEDSR